MNCDDFLIRMHECIDARLPFESDIHLQEHVRQCPSCCNQWYAWVHISAVVSPMNVDEQKFAGREIAGRRSFAKKLSRSCVGLAVVAVIAAVIVPMHSNEIDSVLEPSLQHTSSVTGMTPTIEMDSAVDAAEWWQEVQSRDWIAQTMPTVRRVRDGVAPFGRSIIQAVAILTVGSGARTS
jgi:hypothetical protein